MSVATDLIDPQTAKWQGVHWRVVSLAELGAWTADDPRIAATVDDALPRIEAWLSGPARLRRAIPVQGRVRMCASMEGNAAWAATILGRSEHPLVTGAIARLLEWQWPDGGWNCDRRPAVTHASFNESFGPLRALAARARIDDALGAQARAGADRAAEFLLEHRVDRSHRTGAIAHQSVDRHCWPAFWHYDRLAGLRALHEAGRLRDPRVAAALASLRAARDADGRWTAGARHWRGPGSKGSNVEVVGWGRDGERRMVTVLALDLLLAA